MVRSCVVRWDCERGLPSYITAYVARSTLSHSRVWGGNLRRIDGECSFHAGGTICKKAEGSFLLWRRKHCPIPMNVQETVQSWDKVTSSALMRPVFFALMLVNFGPAIIPLWVSAEVDAFQLAVRASL